MSSARTGLLWCFCFIVLESIQSVFFGHVFQRMDSFLIGALVFGATTVGVLLWSGLTIPDQLRMALANPRPLIGINVSVGLAWAAYLLAVQMIEPAIAFTLFSGVVPLTTILAAWIGVPEANGVRSWVEGLGNLVLACGIAALAFVTIAGWSGFVRGGAPAAVGGVALALTAGFIITWMIFFSRRLGHAGVGPLAQFGLRFIFYLAIAIPGAVLSLDHKGTVPLSELALVVLIGFALMSFPLLALQKAIPLVSPLTIGAISALGPLLIFLLQLIEGRVDYAPATLVGLGIFFVGALIAAFAATHNP